MVQSKSIVNFSGYHVIIIEEIEMMVEWVAVSVFYENSIDSIRLNDPVFKLSKFEQVWSVVSFGTEKYLVSCIYRPDDFVDMNDFEKVFTQARNYVDAKKLKRYINHG